LKINIPLNITNKVQKVQTVQTVQMAKTFTAEEIDVSQIRYSELKKLDSGAKIAYVNYGSEGINSINVQTPEMTFPFDSKMFDGSGKYSCQLSLVGEDVKVFHDKMNEIDNKIKEDAKKNSQAWFGKKTISDEMIEDKFVPVVRKYKDPESQEFTGKYPDKLAFKVVKKDTGFECKFYDENRKKINVNDESKEDFVLADSLMAKGCSAMCILKCNGLWFSSVGFGCSWKAVQMKVKLPENLEEYAFRDDDDEVDSDEIEEGEPEPEKEDSSEEESEESSEEEVVIKKVNKNGK